MTTPADIIKEFKSTPFELYYLKNKEITIIESIDRENGKFREIKEINKFGKPQDFYYIRVEQGLFQKDLKLTKSELQSVMLVIPENVTNLQGVILSVDLIKGVKYHGNATQDLNGNKFGQPAQAPQNRQGQNYSNGNENVNDSESVKHISREDQRDNQVNTLTIAMKSTQMLGIALDTKTMIKISEGISPGNALNLINHAKVTGKITEKDGVYTVV